MIAIPPLHCLRRVTKMLGRGNALHKWRDHLLNPVTADFLLGEDSSVILLQSTISNIKPSNTSFATAFARLATHFAAPNQERDLLRYLRATLQILVIYSIVSEDHY